MFYGLENIIDSEEFISDIFNKKSILKKNFSKLHEVFNLIDFDKYLITMEGNLHNVVRIIKDQKGISIPANVDNIETQRDFVLRQFSEGATLKLEDLDFRNTEIAKMCKTLESIVGGEVFAKPILTGIGKKSFNIHYDMPDIFVIQLEGTKHWKVWPNHVKNPTYSMQEVLVQDNLPDPEIDILLEPGDILYIPGGTPHIARCVDDYSLHMSIGMIPMKIHDVLEGYIKMLSQQLPILRETIYPFSSNSNLEEIKNKIIDQLNCIPIKNMVDDYMLMQNAYKHETSEYRLKSFLLSSKIKLKSKLKLKLGSNLNIRKNRDKINVYYSSTIAPIALFKINPTYIEFPEYCEDAIDYLIKMENIEFHPEDILTKLDSDSKIVLCQELLNAGILILVRL